MRHQKFPWVLMALLLSSVVADWMFDKIAVNHSSGEGIDFFWSLLTKPWFWFGVATTPFQFVIWTRIIRKTDLSRVYPATSISYPVTMILSTIFFGEKLHPLVWAGAIIITIGVAMLGFERGLVEDTSKND